MSKTLSFFFFNDTATTEIYTLSLHDALPISRLVAVTGDLIERLQAQPAYRSFLLDGQTVLVEDYLRACPDREGDLRTLVKTGRVQGGAGGVLPHRESPSGGGAGGELVVRGARP